MVSAYRYSLRSSVKPFFNISFLIILEESVCGLISASSICDLNSQFSNFCIAFSYTAISLSTTSTTWTTYYFAGDTFSDVEIEAGKSVKVTVEDEVNAKNADLDEALQLWDFELTLK